MIDLREIEETISEIRRGGTTIDAAEKLAVMYILRDHMQRENESERDVRAEVHTARPQTEENPETFSYSSASKSEFREACRGLDAERLIDVMDDHMSAMKLLYPKEYDAILKQLKIVY